MLWLGWRPLRKTWCVPEFRGSGVRGLAGQGGDASGAQLRDVAVPLPKGAIVGGEVSRWHRALVAGSGRFGVPGPRGGCA